MADLPKPQPIHIDFPKEQPFHFKAEETQDANGRRMMRFHCGGDAYDSRELSAFKAEVEARIGEGALIALDLGGLVHLSNSWATVLVQLKLLAYKKGGRLELESVSPQMQRWLGARGLDTAFEQMERAAHQRSGSQDSSPGTS